MDETEEVIEVSQADDEDENLATKPTVYIVESDDTEDDDVEVPPWQRPREPSMCVRGYQFKCLCFYDLSVTF